MTEPKSRSRGGCLIAFILWIIIATALAIGWRFVIQPMWQEELTAETSMAGDFTHELTIALDSFSGYAVWRSPALSRDLAQKGIRLSAIDDGADYAHRLEQLTDQHVEFAVFTIDAFVAAGLDAGQFPGSIVLVIDETTGADAVVAHAQTIASVTDLNHPESEIFVVGHSPSEFLARTMVAHFQLPDLPTGWLQREDSAAAVFEQLRQSSGTQRQAFVLWEPYVAQARAIPGVEVLLDSSHLKGFIVDVLVVERRFLRDQPEIVAEVVRSYLRATYQTQQGSDGFKQLVSEDAQRLGEPLSDGQAAAVVNGIAWANTVDNYAYFGVNDTSSSAIRHVDDSIRVISDVLQATGRIESSSGVEPETLYYDGIVQQLATEQFHPAVRSDVVSQVIDLPQLDPNQLVRSETVRDVQQLVQLSAQQWDQLRPMGELRVAPISFGRGSARLTIQAKRDLKRLAASLDAWPTSYCLIRGHSRSDGNAEANQLLAAARAEAVQSHLTDLGVSANRLSIRAAAGDGGLSVSFVLGEPPY